MNDSSTSFENAKEDDEVGQENKGQSSSPEEGEAVADYFGFTEIFKRVLSTADHELKVSNPFLFWSAMGAGGAIGLTFLARVIFTEVAGEEMPGLLGNILYPVGFLIIVLGRYQLFTENTLTPVVLVLTRLASVRNLLRLWVVVFVGNMLGAVLFGAAIAYSKIFTPEQTMKAIEIGYHAIETPWIDIFYKGIIAGWIVASMVWLVHAVRDSIGRAVVIYVLMYFIGVASFFHVITSSIEVFYLAFADAQVDFWPLWPNFVAPVLLGNTLGGIVFVALLNYAQFAEHKDSDMFKRYGDRMSMRHWIMGGRKTDEQHNGKKH